MWVESAHPSMNKYLKWNIKVDCLLGKRLKPKIIQYCIIFD